MIKPMLFSPGPVMVEECVRQELLHHDICHRSREFEVMFRDIQSKINRLFKADENYCSLIISGSGTSANEAVLSSIFKNEDEVLLISNGEFGHRLEEIINKYNIKMVKPEFEWNEYPDINVIEEALKKNPKIKVIAMVFHETSTGMINPVYEVGQISKKYNKTFYVDAVSAAAGEDVNVVKNNIDIVTSVGGKCLGAFPGSAYICAKEDVLKRIDEKQCKNIYLNLFKHYIVAKNSSQTPNTPNVTLFFALNKALERLLDVEGLENRILRYKTCAGILRDGLKKRNFKFLIEDETKMSNTVTSVFMPEGKNVDKFIKMMEEEGYVIYPGKGNYYKEGMIQVANMGNINPDDCHTFLKVLDKVINRINA
ncbi:MAG: alanine--glyoxylate aminotransferase family protein [Peptostreptococcaceae bacterium]|nr:alanine--glyoxylate aminotransferase family protein [Peptostreptococcaceae bacterium]